MDSIKKFLALLLCVCICLGMVQALASSAEPAFTVTEDLTPQEREQWSQWASEEDVSDMSAAAGAIALTPEEEALLGEVTESLSETVHLDDVDLTNLDQNQALPKQIFNILLLGVDNRSTDLQRGRSDANIICSIDLKTGGIKLTSIARDTAVNIPGLKRMTRINTAYYYGGAELAMKTVNRNYQMNIDRYLVVNIHGLSAIIDALGGLDMNMNATEANRINYELIKEPMDDVKRPRVKAVDGVQHLDGMQAVTFARIRGIDSDLERTRRQRQLLETLLQKVMEGMDISKLMLLIQTALPYGDTNLTIDELLTLGAAVISGESMTKLGEGKELMEQMRIPISNHYGWKKFGESSLLYLNQKNLKYTIEAMHEFIYHKSYYID